MAFAAALFGAACAAVRPADPPERGSRAVKLRLPGLASPLVDVFPKPDAAPADPVKAAIFAKINHDRATAGRLPVAWDEGAARVADAFCRQQVREATNGHFLIDGVPPYARTGFSGVFGAQSENSVSWTTTGRSFHESAERLAILGHEGMMSEKPPADGHRRTILDPEATHVGVGYAVEDGRFQMAQEFLSRTLERLSLSLKSASPLVVRFDGKAGENWRLEFVTIAHEPAPAPMTREEANGRTSYSYPSAALSYVEEGNRLIRVSGTDTQDRIRAWSNREFSFNFAPTRPGLYTFVFYTAVRASEPARPGGSATIWVE
jgi:cysteine-rich secretory family protein